MDFEVAKNLYPFTLSIVIPAYNEEMRISSSLMKIKKYFFNKKYKYEIIIVDDGSTDRTVDKVNESANGIRNIKLLKNCVNRGKGYTVKRGMMVAQGRYVIFSDADLSTPLYELENLISWIKKGYDIVVASRGMKESDVKVHQPFYRESMGKVFNLLVQLIVFRGIKDTQCGFKCFKNGIIEKIFSRQRLNRFSFDVEILYIAKKMGCMVKEVPVSWFNHPHSKVHPLKDATWMFLDLFKIRYYDLREFYK